MPIPTRNIDLSIDKPTPNVEDNKINITPQPKLSVMDSDLYDKRSTRITEQPKKGWLQTLFDKGSTFLLELIPFADKIPKIKQFLFNKEILSRTQPSLSQFSLRRRETPEEMKQIWRRRKRMYPLELNLT
jgi:hypothetical protein